MKFLLLLAALASTQTRPPDTAGAGLMAAWRKARQTHPDALLMSITGKTGGDGAVVCDPRSPLQDGWRYSFYSAQKQEFVMVGSCRGKLQGPLRQLMASEPGPEVLDIRGRFTDSDVALQVLAKSGVALDPAEHKGGGRRPYELQLLRLQDPRFPSHPVVWKIEIGADSYLIDAAKTERFSPEKYMGSSALPGRPARPARVSTVKKDYAGVLEYANARLPGSRLMAVEGFVDAWGGTACTGSGDGWAYYFYSPKTRAYDVLYACDGKVGPGMSQYVPVDMSLHKPIEGDFIDSDQAVDSALIHRPALMNEGHGRRSRQGALLLINYRASPFSDQGLWKTTLLWQLKLGSTLFKIDASNGKILAVEE